VFKDNHASGLTKFAVYDLSIIYLTSRFSHSQLGRSIPLSKVKIIIEKTSKIISNVLVRKGQL